MVLATLSTMKQKMKKMELMDDYQAAKSSIQTMEEILLLNLTPSPEELTDYTSVIESTCTYICVHIHVCIYVKRGKGNW